MKRATITQAKNQLSAVLDQVRNGETVLILDRGRPIARIEPALGDDETDSRLARLERAGALRRSKSKIRRRLFNDPPPAPSQGASALETLLDERRKGR